MLRFFRPVFLLFRRNFLSPAAAHDFSLSGLDEKQQLVSISLYPRMFAIRGNLILNIYKGDIYGYLENGFLEDRTFFLQRGRGKEDNTSRQYSRILLRTFLTRTFFEHSGTATGNLHRLVIT